METYNSDAEGVFWESGIMDHPTAKTDNDERDEELKAADNNNP
jgi:hypothetical protein